MNNPIKLETDIRNMIRTDSQWNAVNDFLDQTGLDFQDFLRSAMANMLMNHTKYSETVLTDLFTVKRPKGKKSWLNPNRWFLWVWRSDDGQLHVRHMEGTPLPDNTPYGEADYAWEIDGKHQSAHVFYEENLDAWRKERYTNPDLAFAPMCFEDSSIGCAVTKFIAEQLANGY